MDKQNYTPNEEESQAISKKITEIKEKLIENINISGVIKRRRKLKSTEILVNAIVMMITNSLSYRRLSEAIAVQYKVVMSDTAWKKQISKCSDAFYEASIAIAAVISDKKAQTYLIDASNIPKEGRKGASMRIHCSYCLERQNIDEIYISDWHKAESLSNFSIHHGALYIADRAYGKASQMSYILNHNADFLLRISPNHIRLYSDCNCEHKIFFSDILRNTKDNNLILPCYFKFRDKRFHTLIIASKIPDDKLAAVERRKRNSAIKKQYNLSENSLLLSNWVILATSLDNAHNQLFLTYSKRWQIELLFKRAKSIFHFHSIRHGCSNYSFMMTRLWSAVVFLASFAASFFSIPKFDFFSIFMLSFS